MWGKVVQARGLARTEIGDLFVGLRNLSSGVGAKPEDGGANGERSEGWSKPAREELGIKGLDGAD